MLNAARIAERKNRPTRYEEVEVGGESVRIRVLKMSERERFQLGLLNDEGKVDKNRLEGGKARFIAMCVVDENNEPFLSPKDVDEAFEPKDIDDLNEHCQRINNMNAKAVEEAAGN